ncbi:ABC transporter ATP-binding protein [Aquibacillus rhizosphaerae]|uniref:ATP-binding cassette domain-containing protein n=1 Tax=Aquibacillus rhizosphaerae TaxID=3051431 RepID=A0ABT7LCW2_9BACI|nr:ATP-binding cassette domain-containing protein [Aquibacillus sp. LR5S19]MDL4842391.1 ATP-binding cassette domain-containing protein [Aquibacillus sp. LR5S19]
MLLEAKNIGFKYGAGDWLFRHVDLQVEALEVVGITGPSGVGKTTFSRILADYELPNEGTVTMDGKPIMTSSYHPVQLVFQHPEKAVNPRWKLRRTLNEGWQPNDDFLDKLGIKQEWLNRWPNELSGGELQRFCVARALGPKTKFLIADEMTTMLDAVTQAQIWHAVLDIAKERNMGVLVISHDQHLINRVCTRVLEF